METKEKEFKGLVINGFIALVLFLALTALSVYGIVYFANNPDTIGVVLCIVAAVFFMICLFLLPLFLNRWKMPATIPETSATNIGVSHI